MTGIAPLDADVDQGGQYKLGLTRLNASLYVKESARPTVRNDFVTIVKMKRGA